MKIFVFLALFELISAYYVSDSPCIDRPLQMNFEIESLTGRWYMIAKYDNVYEKGSVCNYGTYTLIDQSSLSTNDCELVNGVYQCVQGFFKKDLSNPEEPKYTYAFADDITNPVDDNFKILSADFPNYLALYDCKNLPDGKSRNLFWFMTQKPIIDESIKAKLDAMIDQYFVRKEIRIVDQSAELCDPRT